MFTYRVRPRVIRFKPDTRIRPPIPAEITFVLAPKQAFGSEPGGGRTTVRSVPATIYFDRSTGHYSAESAVPLVPITLSVQQEDAGFFVVGERITVTKVVDSQKDLSNLIDTVYYLLPLLLAVDFADPPVVEEVKGVVGDAEFGWYLVQGKAHLLTTTQEKQTNHVKNAWHRLQHLVTDENRRLVAALHYFHVAARLERVSASPGEFLAEALLNYSKVLDVLFSPSTDEVRKALADLGYSHEEIERDFIPVMYLRSQIDVAHVSLTLFNEEQLSTLHRFADRVEVSFRQLLGRLLDRFDEGTLALPEYQLHGADASTARTIEHIARWLDTLGDPP